MDDRSRLLALPELIFQSTQVSAEHQRQTLIEYRGVGDARQPGCLASATAAVAAVVAPVGDWDTEHNTRGAPAQV